MTSRNISYLLNREKGQYPISIATSLALESLMNIHPDTKHPDIPKNRFNELWCNIRTLFRNLYTSMDRLSAERLSVEDYVYGMTDDINNLVDWANLREVQMPIVLYHSHYEDHKRKYPYAKLRDNNTIIQKAFSNKMEETINYLFKNKQFIAKDPKSSDSKGNIYVFDDFISPIHYPNVGMLTHYCYDLLDHYSFSKLYLVESHAGGIKDKTEWYTKYYNGNQLPPMPFILDLLQILGDKEMFSPAPKKVKDLIIEVANKYNWTPMTTREKVILNIQLAGDIGISQMVSQISGTSNVR